MSISGIAILLYFKSIINTSPLSSTASCAMFNCMNNTFMGPYCGKSGKGFSFVRR